MKASRCIVPAVTVVFILASLSLSPGISDAFATSGHVPGPEPGGKIVFGKVTLPTQGYATSQLFSIDADGSDMTPLTASGTYAQSPVWSPSGTSIAFLSFTTPYWSLQVMDATGGSVRTLTRFRCDPSSFDRPAWSADGSKLMFETSCPFPALWTINADGSGLAKVRWFPRAIEIQDASWSPDGSKIVLAIDFQRKGVFANFQIFTMNADGTGLTRLTSNLLAGDESPQYSPNGSRIVFSQDGPQRASGVVIMRSDGSHAHFLTKLGFGISPTWSRYGRWIAFSSGAPPCDGCARVSTDLFIVRTDGLRIRRLTLFPKRTAAWFPYWQP